MEKKVLYLLSIIIGLAILAVAFLKPSQGVIEIISADRKFELHIPRSAISKSVLPEEISAERVFVEDINGVPVVMYKLSPEGLTFSEPVTFTATMEIEPGDVPTGLHVDGVAGEIKAIKNHHTVLGYTEGVATITGTIRHFSSILLIKSGIFATIHRSSNRYTRVGESREISVSISAIKDDGSPSDKINNDVTAIYTRVGLTTMKGDLTARTDTVTPAQIQDVVPRVVLVPGGGAVHGSGMFTCVKDGYANQSFDFSIYTTVETEFVGKSIIDAVGRTFLGRNTKVTIEDYVYELYNEGYSCLGTSSASVQETATTTKVPATTVPKEEVLPVTQEKAGTGAKICGGIFGPCGNKNN